MTHKNARRAADNYRYVIVNMDRTESQPLTAEQLAETQANMSVRRSSFVAWVVRVSA